MDLPDVEATNIELVACSCCERTFFPEALKRHEKICQKTSSKKRKLFDSARQRYEGTGIPIPTKTVTNRKPCPAPKKKFSWREKHEELLDCIRAAKHVTPRDGGPGERKSPVTRIPSDYVRCDYCGRNFNQRSAERHIEWCKEHQLRASNNTSLNAEAKERLQARTNYRAPLPSKLRQATKQKYSSTASLKKSHGDIPRIMSSSFTSTESLKPLDKRKPLSESIHNVGSSSRRKDASPARTNKLTVPTQSSNKPNNKSRSLSDGTRSLGRVGGRNFTLQAGSKLPFSRVGSYRRPALNSYINQTEPSKSPPSTKSSFTRARPGSLRLAVRTEPEGIEDNSRKTYKGKHDEYNPYVSAERQFQELFMNPPSTSPKPPSPSTSFKLYSGSDSPMFSPINSPMSPVYDPFTNVYSSQTSNDDNDNSDSEHILSRPIKTSSPIPREESPLRTLWDGPRFCHECGGRYPIAAARFCCECGVRRLCI